MDVKSIRDNAVSFKHAAERCMEARRLSSESFQLLAVPAIVNIAFSAELFLKFLISSKGLPVKGHNLMELYSSLEDSTKTEIINQTPYPRDKFEQSLLNHSELFVEWRYVHEKHTAKAELEFMNQFVKSLEIISMRLPV